MKKTLMLHLNLRDETAWKISQFSKRILSRYGTLTNFFNLAAIEKIEKDFKEQKDDKNKGTDRE
jgi:hypothetical protein